MQVHLPCITEAAGGGHCCLLTVAARGTQDTVQLSLQTGGVTVHPLGARHGVSGPYWTVIALRTNIGIRS